ncbi:thiamine phosphate synthase [Parvularcula sp. LCG005]|uniref:thiamine phosphate synthase n=1 Tax=Parvularcula sp. LCG005 TaxID=3078805 RepID=UPI00294371CA|nr:thiamine phosphate synthase [Parvularcula sp. LCG005]WOI52822.1 thiamine phosphate synthase [Parvularcula sp. LCG005]
MLDCQLYLITPPTIDLATFPAALEEAVTVGAAAGVEVACLQLRLKDVPDDEIVRAALVLKPVLERLGVALIVNDRADLARKCGAQGLHLGQSDGSVEDARALLGASAEIGVTCHDSRHLAMEAAEAGADYVAFGAFYPTSTKQTEFRPEPEILTIWSETTVIPCVAIGGINAQNAAPLVDAGADYLAVSSAVWDHPDGPGAGVAAFADALQDRSHAAS